MRFGIGEGSTTLVSELLDVQGCKGKIKKGIKGEVDGG